MTIRTGKQDSETYQRKVRTGVHTPRTARGRGRGKVGSTLAAGAVAAVMMLAAAPTAFAAAGIAPGSPGDGPHPATPTKSANAPQVTPTPTMSGEMPGMEHGSGDAPASTPTPTMSGEMPGMEHGSGDAHASTPTPTMSGEMPGMEHGSGDTAEPGHGAGDVPEGDHGAAGAAEEADPDRPLAAVLGTFGGGTAAVMVTAGFLRKKDRAADQVKAAARLARRSQK